MIKKKYQKPKITRKKIELSFFLSKSSLMGEFNLIEQVYASTGCACGECGQSTSDCGGCTCSN